MIRKSGNRFSEKIMLKQKMPTRGLTNSVESGPGGGKTWLTNRFSGVLMRCNRFIALLRPFFFDYSTNIKRFAWKLPRL
jgi:hypothetical protein